MIPQNTPAATPRLLGLKEVMRLTSLSEPSIRRYMDAGNFPRARRIGHNRIAWVEAEVAEWIAEKVAA